MRSGPDRATYLRSGVFIPGFGLADFWRCGRVVGEDFFDITDGDPTAGFSGECDVGPAAGLGDDFTE